MIALFLMGTIAALVLPRLSASSNLPASARQMIGMVRSLYIAASTTKRLHRLYLDLDQQTYWAVAVYPDGERPPAESGLAERVALPPQIRLTDVITANQGKLTNTRAMIQFHPGGRTERSILHLANKDGAMLSLHINPLTGSVQVLDRYTEPPTEPLADPIKTAFFQSPGGMPVLAGIQGTQR